MTSYALKNKPGTLQVSKLELMEFGKTTTKPFLAMTKEKGPCQILTL